MPSRVSGAILKAARDEADIGQEAVARAMDVSVKTVQRIEAAGSVKKSQADAYRAALREILHQRQYPRHLVGEPGVAELSIQGYAPEGRIQPALLFGAPDRRALREHLMSRRALKWLLDFRDELANRGADEDTTDAAVRLVTQEENLTFLVGGLAGAGHGFTEEETLMALESAAVTVRRILDDRGLKPK